MITGFLTFWRMS